MTKLRESFKESIRQLGEELETDRDEIKLKLHLVKLELEDKWKKAEEQRQSFRSKSKAIEKSVGEAGSDIGAGLIDLGREIKHAYSDIKKGIKSSKLTK